MLKHNTQINSYKYNLGTHNTNSLQITSKTPEDLITSKTWCPAASNTSKQLSKLKIIQKPDEKKNNFVNTTVINVCINISKALSIHIYVCHT